MFWLRSSSPALLPARQLGLVRTILAVWLLVLAAGVLAPWAQARHMEPVCSGAGHAHWILGPAADDLTHALHGLDCPLCLPQLAAPPAAASAALPELPRAAQAPRLSAPVWTPMPSAWPPPARAPPV